MPNSNFLNHYPFHIFLTRDKCITWTIEWRFHSTDIVLLDHGINENSTLSSVIENHLKPGAWNHKLKSFCAEQLDCLKIFIC
ncbi:unnamed protein product, partial [Vitis vinifera]|uniref:BCD1 alpha/beta domain-containing protein n=1 Tax=Vitis vinifera TaxID=29760 RepID=D7U7Y9_VITVI